MSQSPKSGQFNSDTKTKGIDKKKGSMSQSPKSGQFNSDVISFISNCKEISSQSPKSGQFNSDDAIQISKDEMKSLNPLSRVNSILITTKKIGNTDTSEVSIP